MYKEEHKIIAYIQNGYRIYAEHIGNIIPSENDEEKKKNH